MLPGAASSAFAGREALHASIAEMSFLVRDSTFVDPAAFQVRALTFGI